MHLEFETTSFKIIITKKYRCLKRSYHHPHPLDSNIAQIPIEQLWNSNILKFRFLIRSNYWIKPALRADWVSLAKLGLFSTTGGGRGYFVKMLILFSFRNFTIFKMCRKDWVRLTLDLNSKCLKNDSSIFLISPC